MAHHCQQQDTAIAFEHHRSDAGSFGRTPAKRGYALLCDRQAAERHDLHPIDRTGKSYCTDDYAGHDGYLQRRHEGAGDGQGHGDRHIYA